MILRFSLLCLMSLCLNACTAIAVVDAAASAAVGVVDLAADAAIGTAKVVGKGVGKAADAIMDDGKAAAD